MSRNFLDLSSLRSITKLPHDAGPVQILHFLANCPKLQSQVRRSEKKHLNAAYKQIKYKLDGPQSKIKIQTPAEKAFVLLQAAVGNHHFEDFALRQEMSNVVDGANRILTAVEEYSKEGSHHGQVLAQCHLLRRSLFHGVWGENDGVLKQIGGVTHDLEAKLKANGISSFNDVINCDGEAIARACDMPSTFGGSLRAAAAMILQSTMKLSFHTEEGDEGLDLVIKIERKELDYVAQSEHVKYSLLVYTDRPGGLLLSLEGISEERDFTVRCPEKFGRAYIRLISNLVGLDEQTSVDGNDRIEKSSFSLSPTVVKSTSKSKKNNTAQKQPPSTTAKKRLFESHRSSVSNISDLRIHKRGKLEREPNIECIEINPDDEDNHNPVPLPNKPTTKKAVTPSPHPSTKSSLQQTCNLTPTFNTRSSSQPKASTYTQNSRSNPYSSKKSSSNSWAMQNRYKWSEAVS
jgi:hypothetical protein